MDDQVFQLSHQATGWGLKACFVWGYVGCSLKGMSCKTGGYHRTGQAQSPVYHKHITNVNLCLELAVFNESNMNCVD